MQWRIGLVCDYLEGVSSLSSACSNYHVLHCIVVGNLAVNINYSFHSFLFMTDASIGVSHLNTCFLHQSYNFYTMTSPEISNIN